MKIKNINFIQKYVDLLVIGLCVLLAVWVVWKFIIAAPHRVEYRDGIQTVQVSPSELPVRQARLASQIEQRISATDNPLGELPRESYPYLEEFRRRLARTHFQRDELLAMTTHGLGGLWTQAVDQVRMAYQVPQPPAPEQVLTKTNFNVLASTDDLIRHFSSELSRSGFQDRTAITQEASRDAEKLHELIGSPNPRDFNSVSVGAYFDFGALQRAYAAPPPSEEVLRIPDNWWWSSLVITDVILERETLDEATEQWGNRTRIDVLPGQPSFRSQRAEYERDVVDYVMAMIRDYQRDLSNPPFPPLATHSRPWRSPFDDERELTMEERRLMMTLSGEIAELQRRIPLLSAQLTRERQTAQPPGQPARGTAPPRQTTTQRTDPREEQLTLMRQLLAEKERLYAELTGARVTLARERQRFDADAWTQSDMRRPGAMRDGVDGVNDGALDRVAIWAHDLTIEPGRVYRYRVIVSVLNPLFQRGRLTDEQRAQYYHRLSLESAPSSWSEPIRTQAVPQWFVEAVNPSTQQATVQVWRIFDGMPNSVTFTAAPGDPIGGRTTMQSHDGMPRDVDMHVPAVVVDLYRQSLGSAGEAGVLLIMDTQTGLLQERTDRSDKGSDELLMLITERDLRQTAAPTGGVGPAGPGPTRPPMRFFDDDDN